MRGKIDMVWIDGGHSFDDVYKDIKYWGPLLKVGGLICGHDYETNPLNDVAKAVHHCGCFDSEPVPRVWAYTKTKEPW